MTPTLKLFMDALASDDQKAPDGSPLAQSEWPVLRMLMALGIAVVLAPFAGFVLFFCLVPALLLLPLMLPLFFSDDEDDEDEPLLVLEEQVVKVGR